MRRSPARGDSSQHCPSLYRRLLGERYQCMPAPLRMLHDINNGRAVGRAEIDGAATAMGRLLAHLFGFPPTGSQVPVTVDFARGNGTEIWLREFAGRRLRSIQYLGSGRWQGKLVERFGGVSYAMEAPVSSQGLDLRIVAGRCFGIPMPRFALPFGPPVNGWMSRAAFASRSRSACR